MRIWNLYKTAIFSNFKELECPQKDIYYWRNFLFVMSLVYILPLSLITLIPSLFVSLKFGFLSIAIFDFIGIVLLLTIAFSKFFNAFTKKIIFIALIYALAIVLLLTLGSFGPGLVYMLAASVLMVIVFSTRFAYLSVFINTIFCIAYGLIIHFNLVQVPHMDVNQTLSWATISVNLIFLSAVFSLLIPKMFNGLQNTIVEQIALRESLAAKQVSLEQSLKVLENKNRELEQFAFVISHDLQEPLRMISGFLTQLEKKYENSLDEKARKYIYYAVNGAQKMRSIILNLLNYTSIEMNNEKEKLDINELMGALQQHYHSKLTIHYESLPVVTTNAKLLEEVFKNLLDNSVRYAQEKLVPEVIIRSREMDDEWQFSISDNGIGIDGESQEKIFNLFQRLHNQGDYGGLGMGLPIVKKIIESLQGRIWVKSEPGKGSTFYFTIAKNTEL